jgi:GH25 family lysozyme M1 (1,4-beta-N-acetylmuramidase)
MPDTRLADISEYQENIDARAYLGGGYGCLIVRAHNGWRPDNKWPARRDYLRGYPFTCLGFYQYLVASRDARQQAHEFVDAVGSLRANEFVILDHEEGGGAQTGRAEAWFSVVDPWCGHRATLYAGQYFCRDHLGGWDRWKRPRWLAAYQGAEPRDAHELWQNTDAARFPGLAGGVDGNIFHGTQERFRAVFTQSDSSPATSPPSPAEALTDAQSSICVVKRNGGRELFVETSAGTVWHTWDTTSGWERWHSMGTPGR